MGELWVVNASPVIALAKAHRLGLLEQLCGELLLPEQVAAEILAGPQADPARQALERGWGNRVGAGEVPTELLEWGLGPGETAVLAVALERAPATALLDDAAGRACAKTLRIPVIGTLGVVLRAKARALVPSAREVLEDLRACGLYIDDDVVRSALAPFGESWD